MMWHPESLRLRTHRGVSRTRRSLRPHLDAMEERCLLTSAMPAGIGVMGDSFSNPARYPSWYNPVQQLANPWNWVQQLAIPLATSGLSFGDTTDNAHYSYVVPTFDTNDTNAYDAAQFQAPALLNLIQSGDATIDAGVLEVGSHDLGPIAPTPAYNDDSGNPISNTYLSIYNGQLSGTNLSNYIDRTIGYILSAATQLQSAGANMVVADIPDFGNAPGILANPGVSDPAKRQLVTDAVNAANARLQTQTDLAGIPLIDFKGLADLSIGTNPLIVGGVTVVESPAYGPTPDFFMDQQHPGAIASGLFANMVVEALDGSYGYNIDPLTDQQILQNAGLGPQTGGPTYFNVTQFVHIVDHTAPTSTLVSSRAKPTA